MNGFPAYSQADIDHLQSIVKVCECSSCHRLIAKRWIVNLLENLPVWVRDSLEIGGPVGVRYIVNGRSVCQACSELTATFSERGQEYRPLNANGTPQAAESRQELVRRKLVQMEYGLLQRKLTRLKDALNLQPGEFTVFSHDAIIAAGNRLGWRIPKKGEESILTTHPTRVLVNESGRWEIRCYPDWHNLANNPS